MSCETARTDETPKLRVSHGHPARSVSICIRVARWLCMHPPLDRPHPFCQDVITALRACHSENPLSKLIGVCNDQKWALDACFKVEKEAKRKENHEKAKREAARLHARVSAA